MEAWNTGDGEARLAADEARNPKHEMRNKSKIQRSNGRNGRAAVSALDFPLRALSLFRISCFAYPPATQVDRAEPEAVARTGCESKSRTSAAGPPHDRS